MHILLVVGTRPNFVKIAPIIEEIKKHEDIEYKLVHTGQHYDNNMSDIFFNDLNIPNPDFNLRVGSGAYSLQMSLIIYRFGQLCKEENPDIVLVVGDVTSTVACAIAASNIAKVAHVEAGCRSFDRSMPEEVNRVVTDVLSDYLFPLTEHDVLNLKNEGISQDKIFLVGNTMIDALIRLDPIVEKVNTVPNTPYVYFTLHRQVNVDIRENLETILKVISELSKYNNIMFPIHPRTLKQIRRFEFMKYLEKVNVKAPISYVESLALIKNSNLVITDSGGVQVESSYFSKPCLILRDSTEHTETLLRNNGTCMLTYVIEDDILDSISLLLKVKKEPYRTRLQDGKVSKRIVEALINKFNTTQN